MRAGKSILVWAAALMMIANPASACRWRVRSYCGPAYCGPSYCAPSSCGPVYSEPSCSTSVPADCSACGESAGEPVTTNHVPDAVPPTAPPEPATPPPTFEPAPSPAPAEAPVAPPATAPATEPEPFAAPAEDMPAKTPPAAPAPKSDVEDLFSEPTAPAETPAAPAEKPAAPSSDVEDLFKEPATTPTAPEKPTDEVDDLFKDLDDKKAAASDSPAEAPSAPEGKEIEDLFSDPQPEAPMSAGTKPATVAEEVAVEPINAPAEPVVAQPTTTTRIVEVKAAQPGQQAGMRLWTDDTGKFQVRGRLVVVGPTHVRLLKENGRFTTVPYGRLSQADLAFVKQHSNGAVVASF